MRLRWLIDVTREAKKARAIIVTKMVAIRTSKIVKDFLFNILPFSYECLFNGDEGDRGEVC